MWGDWGFIHLCFDVQGMDVLKQECADKGFAFTVDSAETFAIVQIAGLIARRIVCEVKEGQNLNQGDRIGIIRFGSRVDLYFENDYKLLAKQGQTVVAGESLLAKI